MKKYEEASVPVFNLIENPQENKELVNVGKLLQFKT